MSARPSTDLVDLDELRDAIRAEYCLVASEPEHGFHFHTGRRLAGITGYDERWLAGVPEEAIASFAGTGNPFAVRELSPGERVVDLGCGAGMDTFIAARQVGPRGAVVGIDMTPEMLDTARRANLAAGLGQIEFREGYLEDVPVADGWADVVISNGVVNLCPDKRAAFAEMRRILRPGGRVQIGDIMVTREVPEGAKRKIDLWTG